MQTHRTHAPKTPEKEPHTGTRDRQERTRRTDKGKRERDTVQGQTTSDAREEIGRRREEEPNERQR